MKTKTWSEIKDSVYGEKGMEKETNWKENPNLLK